MMFWLLVRALRGAAVIFFAYLVVVAVFAAARALIG